MKRLIALAFLFLITVSAIAQEQKPIPVFPDSTLYDYDLLPASFFESRRKLFRDNMPDGSAAIFFAAPVRNRSNDVNFEYHQDPNFYYYTGHTQPEAVIILFKEQQTLKGVKSDEFIFIKKRNAMEETWTGKIMADFEVAARSGIKAVMMNSDFEKMEFDFSKMQKLLVKFPTDISENSKEEGSAGWLVSKFKNQTNEISERYDKVLPAKINAKLREVKTDEELKLLQKAVDLTCLGFIEALKAAEPGMKEFELEAINEFIWRKEGSEYAGYPSIVGGGLNSCVLHYETNRKKLISGDIVVMDMGAEYHGYTADVTRSFPVNGKFSNEQKIIYNLVLEAQNAGIAACKPGAAFSDPHRAASKVIADGLMKLGIIKEPGEVTKYFMHGTSHYLGLDVHDAGTYGPLQPNTVITVEPGIYIKEGADCDRKWWNTGVRIEDDILITTDGHRNMSGCVPKTIPEIEKLMEEKSVLNELK